MRNLIGQDLSKVDPPPTEEELAFVKQRATRFNEPFTGKMIEDAKGQKAVVVDRDKKPPAK